MIPVSDTWLFILGNFKTVPILAVNFALPSTELTAVILSFIVAFSVSSMLTISNLISGLSPVPTLIILTFEGSTPNCFAINALALVSSNSPSLIPVNVTLLSTFGNCKTVPKFVVSLALPSTEPIALMLDSIALTSSSSTPMTVNSIFGLSPVPTLIILTLEDGSTPNCFAMSSWAVLSLRSPALIPVNVTEDDTLGAVGFTPVAATYVFDISDFNFSKGPFSTTGLFFSSVVMAEVVTSTNASFGTAASASSFISVLTFSIISPKPDFFSVAMGWAILPKTTASLETGVGWAIVPRVVVTGGDNSAKLVCNLALPSVELICVIFALIVVFSSADRSSTSNSIFGLSPVPTLIIRTLEGSTPNCFAINVLALVLSNSPALIPVSVTWLFILGNFKTVPILAVNFALPSTELIALILSSIAVFCASVCPTAPITSNSIFGLSPLPTLVIIIEEASTPNCFAISSRALVLSSSPSLIPVSTMDVLTFGVCGPYKESVLDLIVLASVSSLAMTVMIKSIVGDVLHFLPTPGVHFCGIFFFASTVTLLPETPINLA